MPTNLTETSTWVTPVVGIADGDGLNQANLTGAETSLTERTKYLRDHSDGARTVTQELLSLTGFHSTEASGTLLWNYLGNQWVQMDVTAAKILACNPRLPTGVTVTQVRARLVGDQSGVSAHAGLPGTLPTVVFREIDPAGAVSIADGGSVLYSVSQVDTSASQAAYDATHLVTLTVNRVIDPTKKYEIKVTGETGANSSANHLAVYAVDISWTAP